MITESEKIKELIEDAKYGASDYRIIASLLSYVKEAAGVKSNEILSPAHVMDLCEKERKSMKEHSIVIFLDTRNKIIKKVVSVGTLNFSLVHPREIFRPAIVANACSIIFVHNHPSGICEPSDEDRETTKRLKEAGKIVGIKLIDSIIVTKDNYFSFNQEGYI